MEEFVPAVRDFSTTSCWGSLVWTPRWEFIWTRAPTEACSSVKELDTKALGNQKPVGANCVTRKTVHPACSRHTWQCSRCWNKSLSSPEAGEVQGWDRRNLRRGIPWNGWVEDPCQARRCWRSTATERAESSDYAGNDAANQGWWRNAVVEPWRQKVRVDLRRCVRNQRDADHRNDVVADVERHQCSKEMDQKPESWSWGWQIPVDKGARPKARESRPREKWGEDVSCEFQQWGHSYNKTSKRRHQDVSCRFQQWDDNNSKTSRRRQNSQSKEWEKPIRVWEKSRERKSATTTNATRSKGAIHQSSTNPELESVCTWAPSATDWGNSPQCNCWGCALTAMMSRCIARWAARREKAEKLTWEPGVAQIWQVKMPVVAKWLQAEGLECTGRRKALLAFPWGGCKASWCSIPVATYIAVMCTTAL